MAKRRAMEAGRALRRLRSPALVFAGLLLLIAAALLSGALIPANPAAAPPPDAVTIHVYTNGVHTGLVLPTVNGLHDWRPRVPASDLPDPRYAGPWLLFGWGERDFYLDTPRWEDLSLRTAARALIGSDSTLLHVDHLQRLWKGPDLRPIRIGPAQYRALVADLESDFASGAAIRGYGADDVFYPAHGRYSAIMTCNEWTGEKLRRIGVPIGLWTPTSWSVMRWF